MISRGLSATQKFYDCHLSWFIPCGHLKQGEGKVTQHEPINLHKVKMLDT